MTTDITKLAQKRNAAISQLSGAFEPGHINQREVDALSYAVDVMNELVEALEKAQKSKEFLKGQLSELANFNPDWDKLEASYESWREIAAELLVAKDRIAELESRTVTVKLPDIMPPEAAPAHYWVQGESMAYADGYNKSAADLKTSLAQACSSAGVNVEFE